MTAHLVTDGGLKLYKWLKATISFSQEMSSDIRNENYTLTMNI